MSSRTRCAPVLALAFASMSLAACGGTSPSQPAAATEQPGDDGGTPSSPAKPPPAGQDAGKVVFDSGGPVADGAADSGTDASEASGLPLAGPLVAATDAKGILHVIYTTEDHVLHTRAQTAAKAAAPWTDDALLATAAEKATAITAAVDGTGSLVVVYADQAQVLRSTKLDATATAWSAPELVATTSDTATQLVSAANADGHLEVIYTDSSQLLHHTWQQGAGGAWNTPVDFTTAGAAATQLAVAASSDGRLDVVYVGTDGQLYENAQTVASGGWDGQSLLGGQGELAQSVAFGSVGGELVVFYTHQQDQSVQMMVQKGTDLHAWTAEVSMGTGFGPVVATRLVTTTDDNGCLELLYTGAAGTLYQQAEQCTTSGQWTQQAPVAGVTDIATSLAAGAAGDGSMQVFFVGGGQGHFLYRAWMTTSGWNGPEQL